MSHELVRLVETAPQEVPSTEEILKDYGLFWKVFGQVLLSRVLAQEFNGNTEELRKWAEESWEEHPRYTRDKVIYSLIQPPFASGAEYWVGIFPQMIYYLKGLSYVLDPGFKIKIWPKLERERVSGDTGTYASLLADLSPVKLELMVWMGDDCYIEGMKVLMMEETSVLFQNGQVSKIRPPNPRLFGAEQARLIKGVNEGPISRIWFPRDDH